MITKIIDDKKFIVINNENEFKNYLLDKESGNYCPNNNYLLNSNIDWNKIHHKYHYPINNFNFRKSY